VALDVTLLPPLPALVRVASGGRPVLAEWREGVLRSLVGLTLDALLGLPLDLARAGVERAAGPELDPAAVELLAPSESQEVWAAGVTYRRSREARIEESAQKDVYAQVYESERPELFFKAAGWRVAPSGGEVGIRPDSSWDVPEPELAVLSNSRGEVVAYACANDMSSRSIEGENPLYLPQAKVYDRSCSIGPAAVPAWERPDPDAAVTMDILRGSTVAFEGSAHTSQLVRSPAELAGVLHACYPLPAGAWLLTGTGIVPNAPYTAAAGDVVRIAIDGLGTLVNRVVRVPHSGAAAPARDS
jgi:2-dehydro-3-deoxy-D-arabinonate dehydratase